MIRPMLCAIASVLALASAAGCAPSGPPREGLRLFAENKLADALPFLQRSARLRPRDAETQAWLAETCRRLGRFAAADSAARRALAVAPCHAFAHTVLADLYNPQYSGWESTDADSAWTHIQRAVACDSSDANLWPSAWVLAMSRGDRALESRALRSMVGTGFLTPALLACWRWTLESLPRDAVFLCNGDMDTYPSAALQQVEGVRRDVAVVNLPLLNTTWYRRIVRDRHALPLPADDAALDAMQVHQSSSGNIVTVDRQIVTGWMAQQKEGKFPRPLAFAITVADLDFGPDSEQRLVISGPFWLCVREPATARMDTAQVRASLAALDRRAVSGSYLNRDDRSPVRRIGAQHAHDNIGQLASGYASALLESGRPGEARAAAAWALAIARETGASQQLQDRIAKLAEAAGKPR
ncbi:MAG: hypothetical protein HZC42_05950 [Candidatus Eisenbacteria bacterium]|nr:hypothetical protein [Candidatus Eisenbacteria bacterium]